jgi:hypothetical protein
MTGSRILRRVEAWEPGCGYRLAMAALAWRPSRGFSIEVALEQIAELSLERTDLSTIDLSVPIEESEDPDRVIARLGIELSSAVSTTAAA